MKKTSIALIVLSELTTLQAGAIVLGQLRYLPWKKGKSTNKINEAERARKPEELHRACDPKHPIDPGLQCRCNRLRAGC